MLWSLLVFLAIPAHTKNTGTVAALAPMRGSGSEEEAAGSRAFFPEEEADDLGRASGAGRRTCDTTLQSIVEADEGATGGIADDDGMGLEVGADAGAVGSPGARTRVGHVAPLRVALLEEKAMRRETKREGEVGEKKHGRRVCRED